MHYLVCYDIVEDRPRYRVAKLLEAYGLRVQKSVFEVIVDDPHFPWLETRLTRFIDLSTDQIRFYPLSKRSVQKQKILGTQPEFRVDQPFVV